MRCIYETGDDWVPGGGGRRTASGPEGSSAKAFPSGAQVYLVVAGPIGVSLVDYLGISLTVQIQP